MKNYFLISKNRIFYIKKSFSDIRKYLKSIKTAPHREVIPFEVTRIWSTNILFLWNIHELSNYMEASSQIDKSILIAHKLGTPCT